MPALRKILLVMMALVLALAPAAASAAQRSMATPAMPGASGTSSAMPDCHKPAPAKSTTGHCKHCNDDGGCTPEACALKCFKMVADLETPGSSTTADALRQRPLSLLAPPGWLSTPPPPPPRA